MAAHRRRPARPRADGTIYNYFAQVRPYLDEWSRAHGHLREITTTWEPPPVSPAGTVISVTETAAGAAESVTGVVTGTETGAAESAAGVADSLNRA